MANEMMIPALPCVSINDTLAFYVAMGFEITYQQARPNTYACVKRDNIELHFFTMKGYDNPANSYSTCLVLVDDVQDLHRAFAARLREHYGKLPIVGIPRITRPNNNNASGDFRFNVVDPGGNWIRFIQKATATDQYPSTDDLTNKFSRAIRGAALLKDSKGDYPAAAKILDTALADVGDDVTPVQRVQALILRAEVAAHMGDDAHAKRLLGDMGEVALTEDDKSALVGEFERMDELAAMFDVPQSAD